MNGKLFLAFLASALLLAALFGLDPTYNSMFTGTQIPTTKTPQTTETIVPANTSTQIPTSTTTEIFTASPTVTELVQPTFTYTPIPTEPVEITETVVYSGTITPQFNNPIKDTELPNTGLFDSQTLNLNQMVGLSLILVIIIMAVKFVRFVSRRSIE